MRGSDVNCGNSACGHQRVKRGNLGDLIIAEHWWRRA